MPKKGSILLTYGEKELEALNEIDDLVKKEILPNNRNEILRRGIHCCRYLSTVDEQRMFSMILSILSDLSKAELFHNRKHILSFAESLAALTNCVEALLIAKYGVIGSQHFINTASSLSAIIEAIRLAASESKEGKDIAMPEEARKLATQVYYVINTVFVK